VRNIFKGKTSGLKISGRQSVFNKLVDAGGHKKEASGWVSPDYDKSRAMYLNPVVAAANKCVAALPNSTDTEAYKLIRTHLLQKGAEGEGKTVMITSALPGEGKTLTAINLAFTVARDFSQTVLLVDCDLKKQSIDHMLGINSEKGLADCLLGNTPVPDVIIWPGIEKLTLISGGKAVEESAELLGSPRMKELVQEMRTRYPERYVFFDVPPILTSADALAFAPYVDYIIVVVAAGITPLPEVNSALEFLPKEKILGLVLNNKGE
jgi:non-specific protein-tyrosine kinase